jgi:acetoin utilization deacetylase AcuC-like enzyme
MATQDPIQESADPNILVVEDDRYRNHCGPERHPERPERLLAVQQALLAFEPEIERRTPRLAEPDEILRIHAKDHLERVEASAGQRGNFDADTFYCGDSYDVARLAVGGTIDVVSAVALGKCRFGLAAVRPPGHHAESDRAMGFCLFNNVAIAARAVQAEGVGKLAIIDWDVHHGNGTQHVFEADPSVLYVSTHQYPYYPGTGDAGEVGSGTGRGATVNVPMPAGCGDAEYIGVMERIVAPVLRAYAPEMILVSCGFDAHRDDPLASMDVTGQGYRVMTAIVRDLAVELCEGKLAFVLEGGYAASGLIDGTTALLGELSSPNPENNRDSGDVSPGSALRAIVSRVGEAHRLDYPEISGGLAVG